MRRLQQATLVYLVCYIQCSGSRSLSPLRGASHLEDCHEICVAVCLRPLVEALAALDDDKRWERVAVRRAVLPG